MVGVYDERGYRWYPTIKTFLDNELTHKNRGRWFYAHAGGLADIQFIFEHVYNHRDFEVDGKFSGSSCIIAKFRKGHKTWTFIDSYWLLREKLDTIGKWVGIDKGAKEARMTDEGAKEFYTNASLRELVEYNEKDCVILFEAIYSMQETLLEMGGQLQMTQAASAMNLFRRKYLKRDIETSPYINDELRHSYYASRVEVFARYANDAHYYDINSSFPYSMTKPCPGEFLGRCRDFPSYGLYFADVSVRVPDTYLPPLPTRIGGRLFFPTGRWRGWYSGIDIELLEAQGGRVERVHRIYHFAPFDDLRAYAIDLYTRRKNATDPFSKVAYKLLLNSLYGKFAESPIKQSLYIDPDPDKIDYERDEQLLPGIWLVERQVAVPHIHVPISSHITANSRKALFEWMEQCREFHYCDTDGFSTTEFLSTGDELGQLKLEKWQEDAEYVAPKLYRQSGRILDGNEWKPIEETPSQGVKAKGFSRPSIEKFNMLKEGRPIYTTRMRRVREMARRGDSRPVEEIIAKRFKADEQVTKRFTYPDGETRPWHISEIKDL